MCVFRECFHSAAVSVTLFIILHVLPGIVSSIDNVNVRLKNGDWEACKVSLVLLHKYGDHRA